MPRKPVAASSSARRCGGDAALAALPAMPSLFAPLAPLTPTALTALTALLGEKAHQATAAHSRFNAAHSAAVIDRPQAGTSQNAAASTPTTAPSVLAAYSAATACPGRALSSRSMAGSVAPIAAVAGSNSSNVPPKATAHCHAGAGCAPVSAIRAPLAGPSSHSSDRLQAAITASATAYQCSGRALRWMAGPNASAPRPSPPKNAVTTPSMPAAS